MTSPDPREREEPRTSPTGQSVTPDFVAKVREAAGLPPTDRPVADRPVTHGRHCPCSACARQDWAEPNLAHCGMHGPSCPAVYAPMSDRPVADREPLTLENLGERLSLLSRFATSTGDYVDIEAVLDEWRMTIDAALAQPAVPVAGAEHCGDPTPHEPHDDEGTATGALFVHTCPGSLALRAAQPEDDGLDAAWKEAEAALPEGWHFEIWRTMSGGALGYGIEADAIDPILGGPVLVAGPTPAAALRALAARLSESSEGVERREPQRVALDEIDIHDG